MNDLQPVIERGADLIGIKAEQVKKVRRCLDLVGQRIPFPGAGLGRREDALGFFLPFAQMVFKFLAAGQILRDHREAAQLPCVVV